MNNLKNLYDLSLLKIIRTHYSRIQKKENQYFISDQFLDFLDSIINGLENF